MPPCKHVPHHLKVRLGLALFEIQTPGYCSPQYQYPHHNSDAVFYSNDNGVDVRARDLSLTVLVSRDLRRLASARG